MIFATNSGNNWTSAEMDLPAVNGMKVRMIIIITYYFNEESEIKFEHKNLFIKCMRRYCLQICQLIEKKIIHYDLAWKTRDKDMRVLYLFTDSVCW